MRLPRKTISPAELTQWISKLIADNNLLAFYKCKPWLHLRAEVLREQNHECQDCKAQGKYEKADTVHHKKPVRRYPWLALTKENCTALSDSCHYKRHHKPKKRQQINEERW